MYQQDNWFIACINKIKRFIKWNKWFIGNCQTCFKISGILRHAAHIGSDWYISFAVATTCETWFPTHCRFGINCWVIHGHCIIEEEGVNFRDFF